MEKTKPTPAYNILKGQVIPLEKGKIPPQAVDLELVVLGVTFSHQKFSIKNSINIFLRPLESFLKRDNLLTY